jgi:serine/threonine protein kinase
MHFSTVVTQAMEKARGESRSLQEPEGREDELCIRRNTLAEECGWQVGAEKFLWEENATPSSRLIKKRSLGEGQFGKVEEITVEGIDVPIARKRFFVAHFRGKRAAPIIRRTKDEVDSLLRLSHPHIVSLIGCYQEEEAANHLNMYALMHPVGHGDIKTLLEAWGTLATLDPCEIQSADDLFVRSLWMQVPKWLGCLASALAYMHSRGVHHEDIKPANIIYRDKLVFFTDFSSSRRLEKDDETSTTAAAQATRMFAAPEALPTDDGISLPHGSKTDVFSLGLVFVELIAVFGGWGDLEMFRNYVFGSHTFVRRQYHRVLDRIAEYISQPRPENYINTLPTHKLYREGKKLDKFTIRIVNDLQSKYVQMYQECIKYMLRTERKTRPSAEEVYLRLKNKKFFGPVAVGCYQCDNGSVKPDDSYGDWEWDHLDDIVEVLI